MGLGACALLVVGLGSTEKQGKALFSSPDPGVMLGLRSVKFLFRLLSFPHTCFQARKCDICRDV